jgi:hypothetical protein
MILLKNHRNGIFDADQPTVLDIQPSDLGVYKDELETPLPRLLIGEHKKMT